MKQFEVLNSKFGMAAPETRVILLTAFVKFVNLFPEIRDTVLGVCVVYIPALFTLLLSFGR